MGGAAETTVAAGVADVAPPAPLTGAVTVPLTLRTVAVTLLTTPVIDRVPVMATAGVAAVPVVVRVPVIAPVALPTVPVMVVPLDEGNPVETERPLPQFAKNMVTIDANAHNSASAPMIAIRGSLVSNMIAGKIRAAAWA